MSVADAGRHAFLAERRALSVRRFDELHSPHYDEHCGAISASHALFVARLAERVGAGAPAYVTIERWPGPLPAAEDPRQVPGEVIEGGGYHYYPDLPQASRWLSAAGFELIEQADTDIYWHLLLTRAGFAGS